MSLHTIINRLERVASDNSPLILTGIGAAGVLTTAWLTGRAVLKAEDIIDSRNIVWEVEKKKAAKLVWKEFIPPAISASLTITAIVFANRIGTRRAAAMAAAFTTSERVFSEYREEVVKKIGAKKENEVRDEVHKREAARNPVPTTLIIGDGKVPCLDVPSGQWWECDMVTIKGAENAINYQLLNQDTATQTDYYSLVGIPANSTSGDMGWHVMDKKLNLHIHHGIAEEGPYKDKPYISVDYAMIPMRHWKGSL